MFDDLKIRNKLILLMAGPLAIILLLSALGARDRSASASESRHVETLVSVAQANGDVVDALQQEALYSSVYVGSGRTTWNEELKAARANTDQILGQAVPRLQNDLDGTPVQVQSAAKMALGASDKLTFYRSSVDQGFRPDQIHDLVASYGDLEDTFAVVNTNVADALSDPSAASALRTASALTAYKSSLARQGAVLAGSAEQGSFGSDKAFDLYRKAQASEANELSLVNKLADSTMKGAVRNALATDQAAVFDSVRSRANKVGAQGDLNVDGRGIAGATSTVIKDLHTVEAKLIQQLLAETKSARASAERASNLFLVAAILAVVSAAVAAVFLGRRITRPLERLTDAADRLSEEEMPRLIESLKNPSEDELGFQLGAMTPIDINSADEIGQLARSFNEVQRVAGEVAQEQASLLRKGIGEMFVNLARRNQALLDRQIEFIDELESGEEDPDQLENLYRLDHLATRMRRNAESLLVLAGAEPPRRRGRPAPLANVVRAALAEVEDFGRIELLSFDEVLVASNAAADLAHLLSELMENATNFSPPETRVEVVGHKTKADGYVISVTDHGIGMSTNQLADANESLARPPLVGLAMSRSLGFIVVGRLAGRHGIAVRMMPSAAGGVTAVVSIPPSLIVDTPGGMADASPAMAAPARLQPVLGSPATGLAAVSLPGDDLADAPASEAPVFTPVEVQGLSDPGSDATPGPFVFAPPGEPAAPAPAPWPAEPAPTAVDESALPTRSIFDLPPSPTSEPEPELEPADLGASAEDVAHIAAEVDAAVSPAMPAALSFQAPSESAPSAPIPPSVEAAGGTHLDGLPPRAPQSNRPFFLEDAEPPRAFGHVAPATPPMPPSALPQAAPTSPRLFGGPPPAAPAAPPAEAAPPAPPAAAPLVSRRPSMTPPPAPVTDAGPEPLFEGAEEPLADPVHEPVTEPVAAASPPLVSRTPLAPPAAPAAPEAAPVEAPATTSTGLAKRVPRSAGASRAIPGSEAERGAAATRRSPEEIRRMLAQHSAGRQRAQAQEPVPSGASDERDSQ